VAILDNDPLELEKPLEAKDGRIEQVQAKKEQRAQRVYADAPPQSGSGFVKFLLILAAGVAVLLLLGYGRQKGWF